MIDYIKDLAAVCIIKHKSKFTVSVTFCISSSSFMASSVGAMTWLSASQHRLKRMLSGVVSSCCLVDYVVVDYTGYEISWLGWNKEAYNIRKTGWYLWLLGPGLLVSGAVQLGEVGAAAVAHQHVLHTTNRKSSGSNFSCHFCCHMADMGGLK